MKEVYIMQGVPGAGKSTWIKNNLPEACVVSVDHYFLDDNDSYNFDPSELGNAHKACMNNFLEETDYCLWSEDEAPIVVDNTNSTLWELYQYVSVASARGFEVEVIRVQAKPEDAAVRNVHGVPKEVVFGMAEKLEAPLDFWPCRFRIVSPDDVSV